MGVLQRFEQRLEGLVEGAFARVFGGFVQPVEIASALKGEAEDNKAILAQGRILVPNDYVVALGNSDAERLLAYDAPLRRELAAMVDEHAVEQGWSFVGPVAVRFETVEDLDTGVFRVRSAALTSDDLPSHPLDAPVRTPHLVVTADGQDRVVQLAGPVTRVGRGAEADIRLPDTGVSRLHVEVRVDGDLAQLVDLGSTNGTTVNGRRVQTSRLTDGDRIGLGTTTLVFRRGG